MSALVGRRVTSKRSPDGKPSVVHDVVFDQKTGYWLLLVVDEDGFIAVFRADECVLLPQPQLERPAPTRVPGPGVGG